MAAPHSETFTRSFFIGFDQTRHLKILMRQKFSSVRQLTLLENQTRDCHTPVLLDRLSYVRGTMIPLTRKCLRGPWQTLPFSQGLRGNQRRDAKKHWVSSGHSGNPTEHVRCKQECPLCAIADIAEI